jgi:nucleotide-binding universal stress UspA family protein
MSLSFGEPMYLCSNPRDGPLLSGGGTSAAAESYRDSTSIREILACVDGSELGCGIVPHAQVVAKSLGAQLTLLHVLESESDHAGASPTDPLDWEIRQRQARGHLESLASPLVEFAEGIHTKLVQGRPAEQICAWAERHRVDLTVLCSHGMRGVTDWRLASTARKLIERAPGSILLVPAEAAVKGEQVHYRRILVPLDGSPRAESVLPLAMRIAASQAAELFLLHVVQTPEITRVGPLDAEGVELERRLSAHNRRVATVYLDRLRAQASPRGPHVRAIVMADATAEGGLDRVIREHEVDLVVMSAHGLTGRTSCPCGGLTEYALSHATTPLLMVRDRDSRPVRRAAPSRARPVDWLGASGNSTL